MKTIVMIFLSTLSLMASADPWSNPAGSGTSMDFRQKAESKRSSRWTLQEWLEQKDRNRMMDLWLFMYKPSPYEFFIQGSVDQYDLKTDGVKINGYRSYSGAAAFYAMILGLEVQYENNTPEGYQDLAGLINVRIAGNAVQSTHLSLNYGSKRKTISAQNIEFNQQFAGADLDLYVNKGVGLHYNYRYYFPTTESTLGSVTGYRSEAGIFFDVDFVRFYGNWYSDFFNTTTPASQSNERTGVQTGLRFYF
jgi:hypothetical protein